MENEEKKPNEPKPEEQQEETGTLSAMAARVKELEKQNAELEAEKKDAEAALRNFIDGRNDVHETALEALKNKIKW